MSIELLFGMPAKLKLMQNRLTAARAALLDNVGTNLDGAVTGRASDADMQTLSSRLSEERVGNITNAPVVRQLSYRTPGFLDYEYISLLAGGTHTFLDLNPPNGGFVSLLCINPSAFSLPGIEIIMDDVNIFPHINGVESDGLTHHVPMGFIGRYRGNTSLPVYCPIEFKKNFKVTVESHGATARSCWCASYHGLYV